MEIADHQADIARQAAEAARKAAQLRRIKVKLNNPYYRLDMISALVKRSPGISSENLDRTAMAPIREEYRLALRWFDPYHYPGQPLIGPEPQTPET